MIVALHPEGVDRNIVPDTALYSHVMSPSTRRAWIEILHLHIPFQIHLVVALHPEGVDRNNKV